MPKLKVAIVGTEHCHIRGNSRMLAARDDVEVVAVWGADSVRAEAVAGSFGLAPLRSLDALPAVDLAIVTTETAGHVAALEALQGKAKAVHLDKPLGLSFENAQKVAELARPYGEHFALGFFARTSPLVRDLVERVKAGEIGAIRHMALTFGHDGRLDGWLDDWAAFDDPSRMGYGCFGDLASHMLDIACLMAGDVTPLNCVKETDPRYRLDVGGAATARAEAGALVRVYSSAVMKGPRLDIRVDGEDGSLWLSGRTFGRYDHEGLPVVLREGNWLAASDSPSALMDKLLGLPCAPYAGAVDGLRINQLLDDFERLSKES